MVIKGIIIYQTSGKNRFNLIISKSINKCFRIFKKMIGRRKNGIENNLQNIANKWLAERYAY